jgi:hypothetical protein
MSKWYYNYKKERGSGKKTALHNQSAQKNNKIALRLCSEFKLEVLWWIVRKNKKKR